MIVYIDIDETIANTPDDRILQKQINFTMKAILLYIGQHVVLVLELIGMM